MPGIPFHFNGRVHFMRPGHQLKVVFTRSRGSRKGVHYYAVGCEWFDMCRTYALRDEVDT
jgi:hypothetical protein